MAGNQRSRYFDSTARDPSEDGNRPLTGSRPTPGSLFRHVFGERPPDRFRGNAWRRGRFGRRLGVDSPSIRGDTPHGGRTRDSSRGTWNEDGADEWARTEEGRYERDDAAGRYRGGLGSESERNYERGPMRGMYGGMRGRRGGRWGGKRYAEEVVEDRNPTASMPKRQKRVPGGRIPKHVKAQEYDAGLLYCEVCDIHCMDQNMKASHDLSIGHEKEVQHQAKEKAKWAVKAGEASAAGAQTGDVVPEMARADGNPATAGKAKAELSHEEVAKRWKGIQPELQTAPKFREWANLSLKEALRIAEEDGDRGIVRAVQLEVMAVLMECSDNCRLFITAWSSEPLASGTLYRDETRGVVDDFVVTNEQLLKAEESKSTEHRAKMEEGGAAGDSEEDEKVTVQQPRHWVRGDAERSGSEPSHAANAEGAQSIEEPGTSVIDKVDAAPDEASVEVVASESGEAREGDELKVSVTWKLSSGAWRLALACRTEDSKLLTAKYRQWQRRERRSLVAEVEEPEPVERVLESYYQLRRSFERCDYVYDGWKGQVREVARKLRDRGTRAGSLQGCLQMLVSAAIQGERWSDCHGPCNELVKLYGDKLIKRRKNETVEEILGDTGDLYICYWILSFLLLNVDAASNRKRRRRDASGTALMAIAERMRDLPTGALGQIAAHEAMQAFSAAISNNYYRFCVLYKTAMMHLKSKNTSKHMMEEYIDVVRERAILTMTRVSVLSEDLVYSAPVQISLGYVITILRFEGNEDEVDGDPEVCAVREFIDALPQRVKISGGLAYGTNAMLLGDSSKAEVQKSKVVDVEMLIKIAGKAWRIREAGEGS